MRLFATLLFLILVNGNSSKSIKFERDVLDEHNKHRASHNAQRLVLDKKLSRNATLTAKQAAKSGTFDNISPGQSVFVSCATFKREVTGKEVTDAWYSEVCNPDFDFKNPDNEKARGFTQLVWKDTSRFGVGKATGPGKDGEICVYIVGVYRPPGNLVGFFEENVEKATFDKEKYCKDGEDDSDDDDDDTDDEEEENEEGDSKITEENAKEDEAVQAAVKDKKRRGR